MKQLPLGAPEGLLELEIMTEKMSMRKNTQVCQESEQVVLPLGVPEGLLELEIMTRKIGTRKNTQVCWVRE